MATQELEKMDHHEFRSELVKCLADYYENVRDIKGAGGLHCVKSVKRKFKDITPPTFKLDNIEASSSQAVDAEDGEGTGDDAQSAGAAAVDAPAAALAAAPADTPQPAKKAPATRGDGTGRS